MKADILEIITQNKFDHISSEQAVSELLDLFDVRHLKKLRKMEYKNLIGKTIENVSHKKLKGYDDEGYLEIKFTDGTIATVVSFYGGHTGKSEDEYPTCIYVTDQLDNLEDVVE